MQDLLKSTAATLFVGPILDTDGVPHVADDLDDGDFQLYKNGSVGALNGSATVAHVADDLNGMFAVMLTTSDTNTLGRIDLTPNVADLAGPKTSAMVRPAAWFAACVTGTGVTLSAATLRAISQAASRGANVYYVTKAGNDGTGAVNRPDLPYVTFAAVVAVASSGDTIVVGPGTWTEANDISALSGLTIVGSGWDTLLTQAGDPASTLTIGTNLTLRNIMVKATGTGQGCFAIEGDTITGLRAFDCWLESADAPLWLISCAEFSLHRTVLKGSEYALYQGGGFGLMRDCRLKTADWTDCSSFAICVTDSGQLRIRDSSVEMTVGAGNESTCGALCPTAGSTIDAHNCRITADADNATSTVRGVYCAGVVNLHGGSVTSSGGAADAIDLLNDGGTLTVSGTAYDTSSGTITHVPPGDSIATILEDTNETQTDWHNGGRLDTLIDLIKAKTDRLGTGIVTYSGGPVADDGRGEIVQGDSYLAADGCALSWTITGYGGPEVDGLTGTLRLVQSTDYKSSVVAPALAALELDAALSQTDDEVTISVDMTGEESASLTVVGASTSYTGHVVAPVGDGYAILTKLFNVSRKITPAS